MKNKKKGFTLVELIVVLAILAILAAMLVPALTGYIDKANQKKYIATSRNYYIAAQTVASESYAEEFPLKNVRRFNGQCGITWGDFQSKTGLIAGDTSNDPDNRYVKSLNNLVTEFGDETFSFEVDSGRIVSGNVLFEKGMVIFDGESFIYQEY